MDFNGGDMITELALSAVASLLILQSILLLRLALRSAEESPETIAASQLSASAKGLFKAGPRHSLAGNSPAIRQTRAM